MKCKSTYIDRQDIKNYIATSSYFVGLKIFYLKYMQNNSLFVHIVGVSDNERLILQCIYNQDKVKYHYLANTVKSRKSSSNDK